MPACLAVALAVAAFPVPARPAPPKPTAHTARDVEGWTVHVDDRLLAGPDADLGRRALKCLECQLHAVALALPAGKVKRLRLVPIWLDRTHGKLLPAQYHPSADWLAENGYDRIMAKCVHIPDAKYFADPRHQREQPWATLHELAHAYHDQVLGFDDAAVKAAWEAFARGGDYNKVLHVSGRKRRHYALTNRMEFFAEMTESYFGHNDFFPFNSGELKREEPEIFKLMATVWGPLP